MKRIPPHIHAGKEYESNVHKFRVVRGLLIRELIELTGLCQNTISSLANGTTSPLYECATRQGEVKPAAEMLAKVLGASIEELFPRYFCEIIKFEPLPDQVRDISHSEDSEDPVDILITREAFKGYKACLKKIRPKYQRVLTLRAYDVTLLEVGKMFGVTKEYARQLEMSALGAYKVKLLKWKEQEDKE